MSCLRKIKKNIENKEKYKISKEELENYKKRGFELKELIEKAFKNKEYKKSKEYSCELAENIKFLRKVKKYADKNS